MTLHHRYEVAHPNAAVPTASKLILENSDDTCTVAHTPSINGCNTRVHCLAMPALYYSNDNAVYCAAAKRNHCTASNIARSRAQMGQPCCPTQLTPNSIQSATVLMAYSLPMLCTPQPKCALKVCIRLENMSICMTMHHGVRAIATCEVMPTKDSVGLPPGSTSSHMLKLAGVWSPAQARVRGAQGPGWQ